MTRRPQTDAPDGRRPFLHNYSSELADFQSPTPRLTSVGSSTCDIWPALASEPSRITLAYPISAAYSCIVEFNAVYP